MVCKSKKHSVGKKRQQNALYYKFMQKNIQVFLHRQIKARYRNRIKIQRQTATSIELARHHISKSALQHIGTSAH
jgi:hypothetical protein